MLGNESMSIGRHFAVLLVLLAIALKGAGCASTGAKFAPVETLPSDKGIVYVFRRGGDGARFGTCVRRPTIFVDDKEIGPLRLDGCYAVMLPPGLHSINAEAQSDRPEVHVDVWPGKSYYIEFDFLSPILMKDVDAVDGAMWAGRCKMEKPIITDLASVRN